MLLTTNVDKFAKELSPGDVLLFDSIHPLSALIKLAENRPVNHAALYLGDGTIAHAARHTWEHYGEDKRLKAAARTDLLTTRLKSPPGPYDRTVTAFRHVDMRTGAKAAAAVVERAEAYVDPADTKYSYFSLLGMMVPALTRTYGRYIPRHLLTLTDAIVDAMVPNLEQELAEVRRSTKRTLTCSQFVYNCYAEGDPGLTLRLTDPIVSAPGSEELLDELLNAPLSAPVSRTRGARRNSSSGAPPDLTPWLVLHPNLEHDADAGGGDPDDEWRSTSSARRMPRNGSGGTRGPVGRLAYRTTRDLALRVVSTIVGHNLALNRDRASDLLGQPFPYLVTPRDLWSSPSLRPFSVLHRPPSGEDSELDHRQKH